jgi:hypothetical protein
VAGDTAYGAVRLLKWLVDRKITPHVPVWDKLARPDGTFSRADFAFDRERNVYVCPGGSELTSTGNIDEGHIVYYRASKSDCSCCSLKPKCTTAIVRRPTSAAGLEWRQRRSVAHSHRAEPEAARKATLQGPATSGSGLLNNHKQHGNRLHHPRQSSKAKLSIETDRSFATLSPRERT